MLLLKHKSFEVSAEGPLVTEEEAQALARADEIVAAAQAEADAIRARAAQEREAELKRGYEAGLAEGREKILSQKLELVSQSVSYMESVEATMSNLVLKVMRTCLGEMDAADLVRRLVGKALLEIVRNQRQVTIRVAPAMVPSVKAHLQALLAEFPSVDYADVKEDEHLRDDACAVETAAGVVEASISTQLESVERTLRKYFSSGF